MAVEQATLDQALDARARSANIAPSGVRIGRHLSLQERFDEWLATEDGRFVYDWIAARAKELIARGWTHYGIAALWESARFSRDLQIGPNSGFRLNNDFRSRLARRMMTDNARLAGFFETRELKA